MARNGSGIYSKAEPSVVTQTTIESVVFNNVIDDIVTDLNAARPISAGGTGAATAAGARTALDVAQQQPSGETWDSTAGYGLVVGLFGIGGNSVSKADFSDLVSVSGLIRTAATSTPNAPSTADTWSGWNVKKTTTTGWQFMGDLTGQKVMARFQSAASTFSSWMHVRLLVSTTTTADGTSYLYSDGTRECIQEVSTGTEATTANGSIYQSDTLTWTFPVAFSSQAGVVVTGTGGNVSSWLSFGNPVAASVGFRRNHPSSDNNARTIKLWARGPA